MHAAHWPFGQLPKTGSHNRRTFASRAQALRGELAQVRSPAALLEMSLHTTGTNGCKFGAKSCELLCVELHRFGLRMTILWQTAHEGVGVGDLLRYSRCLIGM